MLPYPDDPGFAVDSDTSQQAACAVADHTETLRQRCLEVLRDVAPMTADEIARYLSEDILSIRPRITELKRMELVEDTGKRRKNLRSGKSAAVVRPTLLGYQKGMG